MFDGEPLWFPGDELLTSVLHAEISAVMQLLAKHPDLPDLFDTPDVTVPQRNICFALLAHRKLIETISNTLAGRQEQPALNEAESHTLHCIYSLVADDAPAWALEMQRVIDRLPAHIYASLPEPLRRGGYNPDDAEQMQAIESAKKTLSSVEQIQALTGRVFDQQLHRLTRRWSAAGPPQAQELPGAKANRLKGTEGLVSKNDLSRYAQYMDHLTEKQHLAFVLKFQYELGLAEIAQRMGGIDRKTADEHIKAAYKKVEQARSNEKGRVRRGKNISEL